VARTRVIPQEQDDVSGAVFLRVSAGQPAARGNGLNARLLVPLTRGRGDNAALQFEVELTSLDQLDQFRSRGIGSREETGDWMHAFSEVLTAPPCVEILHVDDGKAESG
jgi:hypothetical protein